MDVFFFMASSVPSVFHGGDGDRMRSFESALRLRVAAFEVLNDQNDHSWMGFFKRTSMQDLSFGFGSMDLDHKDMFFSILVTPDPKTETLQVLGLMEKHLAFLPKQKSGWLPPWKCLGQLLAEAPGSPHPLYLHASSCASPTGPVYLSSRHSNIGGLRFGELKTVRSKVHSTESLAVSDELLGR